jgi:hypothetical protein
LQWLKNSSNTNLLYRCKWSNGTTECMSDLVHGSLVTQLHAKTFTFSNTKASNGITYDAVSVVTSMNMIKTMGRLWENNAVIVYGHERFAVDVFPGLVRSAIERNVLSERHLSKDARFHTDHACGTRYTRALARPGAGIDCAREGDAHRHHVGPSLALDERERAIDDRHDLRARPRSYRPERARRLHRAGEQALMRIAPDVDVFAGEHR